MQGKAGKGHHSSVWKVLPTLEVLLNEMERGRHDLDSRKRGRTPLAVAH
jgi:hypothetical protein